MNGSQILGEYRGEAEAKTEELTYYYDGSGVCGFRYSEQDYYYVKNLMGDITGIYDSNGTLVARYVYDAWGKMRIYDGNGVDKTNDASYNGIGRINPFRYRGYYYDEETGLYYLKSRYYDPEVGRFINADSAGVLEEAKADINGLNLYAYCMNNPVNDLDAEGDASFWKKLAAAVAVVAVVAVVAAVVAVTAGTATPLCAAATVLVGAAKGAVVGAVTGAVVGGVSGAVQGGIEGYKENGWNGVLQGVAEGFVDGAIEGAKDGFISGMVSGAFSGLGQVASGTSKFCFIAGILVLCRDEDGKECHKPIEEIEVGDMVWAYDEETGEQA